MSYKYHPECVPSGQEWLGEIPSTWETHRLGKYFIARNEKVSDVDYPALSVTMGGIVPQLENAAKTDAGDNRKRVCVGDFVINSRSDRKGSSGVSALSGSVSLISTVLEPRNIFGGFVHQLLRSYPFQEEFYRWGKGIVADLWSTNYSQMKNIIIPVPSPEEQTHIANFLDRETAKIDTLIEKQEQLIKLLEEKRQAVISHAVTKGLNPDVPMKDSGVEWLGDVPEHWGIKKFNHVARIGNGQVDPRDEPYCNYVLIAPNHVQSGTGRLLYTETAADQGADSGKYLCKQDEVVYSKIRPALAKVVICREPLALCSADMYPISSVEPLTNKFLFWFMLSRSFTDAAILDSDRVAMPKVNRDTLGQYKICCPPTTEQQDICLHIEAEVLKMDNLRVEAKRAMELMRERRTALISAAVTGKIDVREVV